MGQALRARFSIWAFGVLAVFLLSCIGYPSQSGFKPKGGRSQAWDALHYENGNGKSFWYEAQKEFIRFFQDAPGIVLSDIDPPYLNVLLPKPFVAAPIDGKHNYSYSRDWHYGKVEALRLVQSGLDHATPVYALLVPAIDGDQDRPAPSAHSGVHLETEREVQFKSCNHDIDNRGGCFNLRFYLSVTELTPNEVIRRYPLL